MNMTPLKNLLKKKEKSIGGNEGIRLITSWLPFCAVDPGHRDVLQDHDHNERQTSRVVVKHGHKVVSRTLHKQQAQQKGDDTANHWETNGTIPNKNPLQGFYKTNLI